MQNSIQMELLNATAEKGFSLDELVFKLRELMQEKGMPGIIGFILNIIDESLCINICQGNSIWTPTPCCKSPNYEILDHLDRNVRTSAGKIQFKWRRLRCRSCGKTTIPLRSFLGLDAYQSKSTELERIVVETISEQSYRRGSKHIKNIGQIPVPKSTAHRWVAASECDEIDPGNNTFGLLLADGTGYKRRPDKAKGISNRGNMRIAFGVENTGQMTVLGAWSEKDWESISKEIQMKRKNEKPVAEMLVSDGEPGLMEALGELCSNQQRCHWHGVRDLNYAMWNDKVSLNERKKSMQEFAGIIGIELPKEDFERVSASDKTDLLKTVEEAKKKVNTMRERMERKGYAQAAVCVRNISRHLFQYVHRWIKTGIVTPRVASWIERVMREIARRLKRIAFGWSEKGAAKMTRIVMKRFISAAAWEEYWKKKLRIEGNVSWFLKNIKAVHPQPLGR